VIPKAEVLRNAEENGLLATTVEKDYILGWVLFATALHPELSRWIFKGGTCLKKCYFDTYRFSEDLDFTLPADVPYEASAILAGLHAIGNWMFQTTGIEVEEEDIEIEEIRNKAGFTTFQARMTYRGPLGLARQNRQRVKFDIARHELLVTATEQRQAFHGYSDHPDPAFPIRCYSLEELLAEKIRALLERSGRARDVYDVVNIGRNFRSAITPAKVRRIAAEKFAFKALPEPTTNLIL
jgi:predicted nucleotidyltransferase component of viral defense system